MRHALTQLPPAQRRAIQLRYLDGLSEEQAAETGRCSLRAIRSSSAVARRKLRAALAEVAPEAHSPLQEMPRHDAARAALEQRLDNVAGAQARLREHGVQVSTTTVYDVRREPDRPCAVKHAPPADTAPEPIRALPPTDRARAAHATTAPATTATRITQLAEPPSSHTPRPPAPYASSEPSRHRPPGTRTSADAGHNGDDASAGHRRSAPARARPEPGYARGRPPHKATRQAAASASGAASGAARGEDERVDRDGGGPPPAELSIARARVVLTVLNAHRIKQTQRQNVEHGRGEQLARWHHEDHQQHDRRTRARAHDRAIDREAFTR